MARRECQKCENWIRSGEGSKQGECRKNAPFPLIVTLAEAPNALRWPVTGDIEWCGDFKPRMEW